MIFGWRAKAARGLPDEGNFVGDLFGEYNAQGDPVQPRWRAGQLWPGLAACATAGAAAAWLADHYAFPVILLGLLIGAALNFVGDDPRVQPGLNFVSRFGLQVAIVLLGFNVSIAQVTALGIAPFVSLIGIMTAAIVAALVVARLLRQPVEAGLLAGGATAICGASAAFALYALMDRKRVGEAHFAVTLAGISLASAIAMSAYPIIGREIGLDDRAAGFLIGATVHDVAQAIGGGYAFSDEAGRYATVVKLTRVALLGPIVLLVGMLLKMRRVRAGEGEGQGAARFALPRFLLLFAAVAVANSFLAVPDGLRDGALTVSKLLLLLAVTATAMRTKLNMIGEVGPKGIAPVLAATLASLIVGLGLTLLQMP